MLLFFQELSADHPVMNIATVIPTRDTMNEVLATNALSSRYSLAIQAALSVGKQTLNCYYAKTDFSKPNQIAMGMHSISSC